MEPLHVGMGEYRVVQQAPPLRCVGLGSCVALALYDTVTHLGGVAHIMLPSRRDTTSQARAGKFVDSSIQSMVEELEALGAPQRRLKAKLFGGANMFPSVPGTLLVRVGERNVQAVKEELMRRRIALVAEDVGGHRGRSILFTPHDGMVRVRYIHGEERVY